MERKHEKKFVSQCFVKNICILDIETGIIVFQKVYKWNESEAFKNLGGLIQVFYQFAREVDDGQITCVNFESGRKVTTRLNQDAYQARDQTMQMKSIKSEHIIVSVFFDMQGNEMPTPEEDLKLDVLINAVLEAFVREHQQELIVRRPYLPQYMEAQNAALEASADAQIVLPFDQFCGAADRLRRQLFPLQDGSGSNSSRGLGPGPGPGLEDVVLSEALSLGEHVRLQLDSLALALAASEDL